MGKRGLVGKAHLVALCDLCNQPCEGTCAEAKAIVAACPHTHQRWYALIGYEIRYCSHCGHILERTPVQKPVRAMMAR